MKGPSGRETRPGGFVLSALFLSSIFRGQAGTAGLEREKFKFYKVAVAVVLWSTYCKYRIGGGIGVGARLRGS